MNSTDQDLRGVVAFGHEVGYLKQLRRSGWSLADVRAPESVAEHSYRVGVLAYAIAVLEGANPDRAAALGLFHDVPETRTGDAHSVGKRYITTPPPQEVIRDQTAGLPENLAVHIVALIDEHESAKSPDATLEARCSRDADKIECLLQAREYQREGYTDLQPWVTSMIEAVATETGKRLAEVALEVQPSEWWSRFAASFGKATL